MQDDRHVSIKSSRGAYNLGSPTLQNGIFWTCDDSLVPEGGSWPGGVSLRHKTLDKH